MAIGANFFYIAEQREKDPSWKITHLYTHWPGCSAIPPPPTRTSWPHPHSGRFSRRFTRSASQIRNGLWCAERRLENRLRMRTRARVRVRVRTCSNLSASLWGERCPGSRRRMEIHFFSLSSSFAVAFQEICESLCGRYIYVYTGLYTRVGLPADTLKRASLHGHTTRLHIVPPPVLSTLSSLRCDECVCVCVCVRPPSLLICTNNLERRGSDALLTSLHASRK